MKAFIEILLGPLPASTFFGYFAYALLGALISQLFHITGRNAKSDRTPTHFSLSFFLKNNLARILTALLFIFLSLRFCEELFGFVLSPWKAILIGLSHDKVAQILKDRTSIIGGRNMGLSCLLMLFLIPVAMSCATQKNAEQYYSKHPVELAKKCAAAFPIVESEGEPVVEGVKPGKNEDHSGAIDSLGNRINQLLRQLSTGRNISSKQLNEFLELKQQFAELKEKYKPCAPDTAFVTRPVYQRDTRFEKIFIDSIQDLTGVIAQMDYRLQEADQKFIKKEAELKEMKESRNNYRAWLFGLLAFLVAFLAIKIVK